MDSGLGIRIYVLLLALVTITVSSGCAAQRTLEDGTTDVVYRAPRASEMGERVAAGAKGLLVGTLAGAAGAVILTGGEPQAALIVSVVTVPTCAVLGLAVGIGNPAAVSSQFHVGVPATPYASAAGGAPTVSPELQSFVRTAAYAAKHQYKRSHRKKRR